MPQKMYIPQHTILVLFHTHTLSIENENKLLYSIYQKREGTSNGRDLFIRTLGVYILQHIPAFRYLILMCCQQKSIHQYRTDKRCWSSRTGNDFTFERSTGTHRQNPNLYTLHVSPRQRSEPNASHPLRHSGLSTLLSS